MPDGRGKMEVNARNVCQESTNLRPVILFAFFVEITPSLTQVASQLLPVIANLDMVGLLEDRAFSVPQASSK